MNKLYFIYPKQNDSMAYIYQKPPLDYLSRNKFTQSIK